MKGETGKAESFTIKTAIYYLLAQCDFGRAFPENICLNPKNSKCIQFYVFVSKSKTKMWKTSLCT